MLSLRLVFLVCLAFVISEIRGQNDFDLSDAVDNPGSTPAPTPAPAPAPKPKPGGGVSDDEFNLGDAVGGDVPPAPAPKPKPGGGGTGAGGNFGDEDLVHAAGGNNPNNPGSSGRSGGGSSDNTPADDGRTTRIGGIVGGIATIVIAAIGTFIAHQKKKFCFKEGAESTSVDPRREVLNERWKRATDPDY